MSRSDWNRRSDYASRPFSKGVTLEVALGKRWEARVFDRAFEGVLGLDGAKSLDDACDLADAAVEAGRLRLPTSEELAELRELNGGILPAASRTYSDHDLAMEYMDKADARGAVKDYELAQAYYNVALVLARRAAGLEQSQPSRAILHRSAAWCAISARDDEEAIRLAREGLVGDGIPERTRTELHEVIRAAGGQP